VLQALLQGPEFTQEATASKSAWPLGFAAEHDCSQAVSPVAQLRTHESSWAHAAFASQAAPSEQQDVSKHVWHVEVMNMKPPHEPPSGFAVPVLVVVHAAPATVRTKTTKSSLAVMRISIAPSERHHTTPRARSCEAPAGASRSMFGRRW
jgi:hypothetical protein